MKINTSPDHFLIKKSDFKDLFNIMKICLFLLFAFTLQLMATNTNAQDAIIELKSNSVTVSQLISEIEKQTDYLVVYSNREVNTSRTVSMKNKSDKVSEYLNQTFSGTDIGYDFEKNYIVLSKKAQQTASTITNLVQTLQQQGKTVRGTVTDSNGEPIIGATIVVQGDATKGTVTDIDGNFILSNLPENAVLQITYVGMKPQEVSTAGRSTIDVIMEADMELLEEIVVVGYGTRKKVNLTSAVSTVGGNELIEAPTTNITNSLAGRLPGLIATQGSGKPGAASSLSIRGSGTFGNTSVLTVVDGIVRDFQHIDPNEVETITILKDASAAAVYGSRAANGVILVTTKRGAIGKPIFNYNSFIGIQNPTTYPKMSNALQYAQARNDARANMGRDPYYTEAQMADLIAGKVPETDWYEATLNKHAPQTQQNISVNGGSEAIKYYMSAGFANQAGLYDRLSYKRYSIRSNVDAKINDYLGISLDVSGIQSNNFGSSYPPEQIFQDIIAGNPFDMVYNPDGTLFYTHEQHPVAEIESGDDRDRNNELQATLSFKYEIPFVKGLSWSGKGSYGNIYNQRKQYMMPVYMHRQDAQGNTTEIYPFGGYNGSIGLRENFYEYQGLTLVTNLDYLRTFGNHEIGGLLLYEQFNANSKNFSAFRTNFPASGLEELVFGGQVNQDATGSSYEDARRSYVGRANYSYMSKYLLEASFRYDGSTAFPKTKKYGFFPAFSAGWRISEESFWKNSSSLDFMNYLKLRLSYGVLGNDRTVYNGLVPTFQYRQYYNLSTQIISGNDVLPSLVNGVLPNPYITWERAAITDIGLDGALWNNLLSFEIDAFYKRTSDILMSRIRSIPATLGASLPAENYAVVDNRGIEISLEHRKNIGDFNYFVRLNGSYAKNKVIIIDEPADAFDYQKQMGRPLGFFVGYKSLGLFQSDEEVANHPKQFNGGQKAGDVKYEDLNGDGIVNYLDQTIISYNNGTPKIMAGLSLGGSYKNFDLAVLFQGAAKRTVMLTGRSQVLFYNGTWNNFVNLLDYWTPENRDATYPRAWEGQDNQNNFYNSSFWLRNGNYLRLKSIDFGYTIPNKVTEKIGLDKCRFYFSGMNLFFWDKLKMFDPEVGDTGGWYYPQQRTLNLGVNISF